MHVKDKKRGRPSKTGGKLSAAAIIKSAIGLLKQNGKVPSIRQIAAALKVDPMAIYHYFPNKRAVLEAVTVELMESIYEPTGQGEWQVELLSLCNSYLILLHNHTGLLETMLSMSEGGPAQIFISRYQAVISPLNLTDSDMKDALDLLVDYLHGFAMAVHCNKGTSPLTVDMARGPIKFYVDALAVKSQKTG